MFDFIKKIFGHQPTPRKRNPYEIPAYQQRGRITSSGRSSYTPPPSMDWDDTPVSKGGYSSSHSSSYDCSSSSDSSSSCSGSSDSGSCGAD